MAIEQEMEFDENRAIEYIKQYLSDNNISNYADDEILNIIDIIWDYYEDNGMLDLDDEDNEAIDVDDIIEHVKRLLKKDKLAEVKQDDVKYIVEGEIAYEKSIGLID